MTEEDRAKAWLSERFGAIAIARLERFVGTIHQESDRQNLVSRSTLDMIWHRHIADSAQLLALDPRIEATWADIGSGAGLPGMVLAILRPDAPTMLIEPRRLRADFLRATAIALELPHVLVIQAKVERVVGQADVITARAVAQIAQLITMTRHLATPKTRWLLPRGGYDGSVFDAPIGGVAFHVEQSLTDARSIIAVGEQT